jgi:hypothetical protein
MAKINPVQRVTSCFICLVCLVAASASVSCRLCEPEYMQPQAPKQLSGWAERDVDYLHVTCDLLLRKGESSSNGKIGVTVADIQPPKPCSEEPSIRTPRAQLKIYRVSDGAPFCERTFQPGAIASGAFCPGLYEATGVEAIQLDINSKEGWVHVELRGAVRAGPESGNGRLRTGKER